jgi:hypothetical protein
MKHLLIGFNPLKNFTFSKLAIQTLLNVGLNAAHELLVFQEQLIGLVFIHGVQGVYEVNEVVLSWFSFDQNGILQVGDCKLA